MLRTERQVFQEITERDCFLRNNVPQNSLQLTKKFWRDIFFWKSLTFGEISLQVQEFRNSIMIMRGKGKKKK